MGALKYLSPGRLRRTCVDQWVQSKDELVFLLRWSWPMIISNLLNIVAPFFVNLVFVGRLSREELAAAALANTWTYGTNAIALGISNAMDTLVSQSYGAKNYKMIGLVAQRATIVTTVASIIIAVLWCLTEYFFILVRMDPDISYMAFKYTLYLLPGLWFGNVLSVMQKYLQGQGLMLPSIYIGLALNALNAFFNYVLVMGTGSFTGIGYVGSPLSTSIAGFKEYLSLGVPASIQHGSEAWGFEVLTILAGLLGASKLDAHSLCSNFTSLTYQFPSGISIAVSVRVGQLLGSNRGYMARRAAWVGTLLTTLIMLVIALIEYLARHQIGYIYTHDVEVVEIAATILPIGAIFQVFDGAQTIFQGVVRGMGRIKIGALANFLAFYVIGIPFACIFTFVLDRGVQGLWWGLCVGLVIIAFGLGVYILRVHWPTEVDNALKRTKMERERANTLDILESKEDTPPTDPTSIPLDTIEISIGDGASDSRTSTNTDSSINSSISIGSTSTNSTSIPTDEAIESNSQQPQQQQDIVQQPPPL
eukprot:gene7279-8460_t